MKPNVTAGATTSFDRNDDRDAAELEKPLVPFEQRSRDAARRSLAAPLVSRR
jgi:hypothetical protein